MKLRVGTRRSPLALTQTRQAMEALRALVPGLEVELVEVVTTGDRIVDRPLREAGGKGLFLKELDEALLDGRIDCAVHSLKDVPTDLAPGTVLAAVPKREDPRDVLVTMRGGAVDALSAAASIGTTSLRRQAQALAARPQARIGLLRGNVQTRLGRLVDGAFDATFLAAAGLARLGLGLAPAQGAWLDPFEFVPAAGQGALGLAARADNAAVVSVLAALDHAETRLATAAERAFARVFGGGCHLPLAAHAARDGEHLRLVGLVITPDGSRAVRDEVRIAAPTGDAAAESAVAAAAAELARSFFARGAAEILAAAEAAGSGS